jgi:hypothetical protein
MDEIAVGALNGKKICGGENRRQTQKSVAF